MLVAVVAGAQATSITLEPPNAAPECAPWATGNLSPLLRTCEYVASLRRSLPDFVCEQTAESGGPEYPTVVIHARVSYEDGRNQYTHVVVDGPSGYGEKVDAVDLMSLVTNRNFGAELIDLFQPPFAVDFKVHNDEMLNSVPASVYRFHIPAAKNQFWTIGDNKTTLHPSYEGELYVDRNSGRPLRTVVRLTGLPRSFQIKSATFDTSYNDVDIADLGVFLLPAYSEVNLSVRTPRHLRRENSDSAYRVRNVVWFHDCKKLAGKAHCIGCLVPPE
ncbi:MAG: hypothetical protein HY010_13690 [Acidobacteria bacterium]|nr:hypothetical protein [Acidobacteriota bacterium]